MHRSSPDRASSRSTLAVAVIGLAAACLPTLVHAQSPGTWPVRPIRMMLGFAPGGPADIVGRTIAPKLTELLGQQVIIENRGGAGGTVATELVARSTPDGYTLTLASQSSYVFAPWLYPKLGYDPVKDFAPISTVVNTPYVVAINPRVPAKTVADLVRLGKGKKAFLTFGSSGPGATSHIGGELLAQATGMPLLHVPYKGTGPSLAALVAGEIDIMIADLGPVLNMVKDGRLRVLAGFGAKRTGAMPGLPTMAEAGFKMHPLDGRFGVIAPAGVSRDIINRLHSAVVQTTKMPDVRQRFEALGYEVVGDTPEQYAQSIRVELEVFGKLIRGAGIKPE